MRKKTVFYCHLLLIIFMSGSLTTLAQAECNPSGTGNKLNCAEIKWLEDVTIQIQSEDIFEGQKVVYGQQEYCITSYTRPSNNSNESSWSRLPFDVKVDGDTDDGGFAIFNGSNSLPVEFRWKGGAPVTATSQWETPGPGNLTSDQEGAKSCNDTPNSQAWVRFDLLSSDLQNAQPGAYSGNFNVNVGQEGDTYFEEVEFTVQLPKLTKISGLDDMILTERGSNRYQQEEPFCVFVSGGGDYRIRASGGPGTSDPFLLKNASNSIPYQVRLFDGSYLETVDPGEWVDNIKGSRSLDCSPEGGTNTRVRIVVLDSWISGKPAGNYTGPLYLTVEPT